MKSSRTLLGLVLVVFSAPGAVRAGSSPAASEWLDKLAAVYGKTPFEFRYEADLRVSQMGQMTDIKIHGHSTQGGERRVRIETTMEMPAPGSDAKLSMSVTAVSDGEVFWIEADNPMTGARQAMKIPLETLEKLADVHPMARNLSKMDPLAQIEEAARMFDFDVKGQTPQSVTLRAPLTGEALERARATFEGIDPSSLEQLTLVLNAANGFPQEIRLGSDSASAMKMRFFDLRFLDAGTAGSFSYAPPDGMAVVDLGALLDASADGAP